MTRILVVDDDWNNRLLLEIILKEYGYEVLNAANGMEALKLAMQNPPDMLVSDILMPVMDGFALCKHCKADARLKDIPFVFYTAAYTDQKDEQFAYSLGAERFILKPQRPADLVKALRQVLDAHRTPDGRDAGPPLGEEMEFFRQHNEALFRKLETKMVELEQANRALGREIEEHKSTEIKLKTTNDRLARAQSIAHIGSWELDLRTDALQWSDETYRILGYAPDEIVPDHEIFLQSVHPDDRAQFLTAVAAARKGERFLSVDSRVVRKDGVTIYVHAQGELIPGDGRTSPSLSGTLMDITERKQADDQIRSSLEEKELLLRELSHRTKNNMNVIVSLIDLQLSSVEDERIARIFEDTKYRIMAMALVHEKLYRSPKLSHVNIRHYLADLADSVLRGSGINMGNIEILLDIDDIYMSIDSVTPLGLVINELLSNSMKYAFPGGRRGRIRIGGRKLAKGEIELSYGDNGVGFAAGYDVRKAASLGLRLVLSLVEQQLKGSIQIDTAAGVSYVIRFREPHRKQDR
ncbi:MAG: response regulator [Nitrospiraceae bacterium]|nr:response regulator [Nitrospiraceae bacterium]